MKSNYNTQHAFHSAQIPENCSVGADCMPMVISWEGATEIQSGDVLIVEIDDSLLVPDDNHTNKGEQK